MERKSWSVVILSCIYNEWQSSLPKSAYKIHALNNCLRKVVQNRFFMFLFLFISLKDMFFSACFICITVTSYKNAKEFRRVTMLYRKSPNY